MRENRKEVKQVKFRVSEREYDRLSQMAISLNMSVPKFCKMKAQGSKVRPPKIEKEGALEIARQLRAIGNNVNQLARRANEGYAIPTEELQAIREELAKLWQQLS